MKMMIGWLGKQAGAFLEWLFSGIDPLRKPSKLDLAVDAFMEKCKIFFICCCLVLWDIGMIWMPFPEYRYMNFLGILWPISSVMWIVYRIRHDMNKEGYDLVTALIVMWKVGDLWMRIFFWPLDAILCLSNGRSLKNELWSKHLDEIVGNGRVHDSSIQAADRDSERDIRRAQRASEQIRELPEVVEVKARTAYACGATVMTLASATAAPLPSTNRVEISTSGWVSVVRKEDLPTEKSETYVSNAHVIVTASDATTGLSVLAELELTQVGDSKANWLQMAYIGYRPIPTDEIRLGHVALAAPWMEPPPFLEEPVSFPRIPYFFYGWGMQYDATRGSWNFLVDVATDSSVRFDDERQLDGAQASFRIKKKFNPKLTLAVAGEITGDSGTLSLDASVKPSPQFYGRGTLYAGARPGQDLVGTYITLVAFPIKGFGEKLDVHNLLDVQSLFDRDHTSLRYAVGARVQSEDKRWSLTADFVGSNRGDRTVEMRFQHRF